VQQDLAQIAFEGVLEGVAQISEFLNEVRDVERLK